LTYGDDSYISSYQVIAPSLRSREGVRGVSIKKLK
jgi:hypothetical protein